MKGFGTVVTGHAVGGRAASRRRSGGAAVAAGRRAGQGARRAGARRRRRRGAGRQSHRHQPPSCQGAARARPDAGAPGRARGGPARRRAAALSARPQARAQAARAPARARRHGADAGDAVAARHARARAGRQRRWRSCSSTSRWCSLPGDRFILRGFALQRHHGTTARWRRRLAHARRAHAARHARALPSARQRACAAQRARDVESARAARGARAPARPGIAARRAADAPATSAARRRRGAGQALGGARGSCATTRSAARSSARRRWRARAARPSPRSRRFTPAQPLAAGMPREELRAKVTSDVKLLHLVLESLAADGALVVDRDTVRLPAHDPARDQARAGLAPLAERTLALYAEAALQPPRPVEAAATLARRSAELGAASSTCSCAAARSCDEGPRVPRARRRRAARSSSRHLQAHARSRRRSGRIWSARRASSPSRWPSTSTARS